MYARYALRYKHVPGICKEVVMHEEEDVIIVLIIRYRVDYCGTTAEDCDRF